MIKFNAEDVEKETIRVLTNKIDNYVAYCIHETDWVWTSKNSQINQDYCVANNVGMSFSFNMGGTIVASKGDVDIALFKTDGWKIGENALLHLKENLQRIIPNIDISGNDLLIDGKYKVASYASINAGDNLIYTVLHISINPNVDLIANICTKPMIKIPRGLSEYGVSNMDIVKIMTDFEDKWFKR